MCFKGLLIADDIVHIHNRIIGAVVSLTFGLLWERAREWEWEVLYSTEALANAYGIAGAVDESYWVLSWCEL